MGNVEQIYAPVESWDDNGGGLLAVVIRANRADGLNFYTGPQEGLQVGSFRYPRGKTIRAHRHLDCPRTVRRTQEVIHVVTGRLRVVVATDSGGWPRSRDLGPGDTVVLLAGSHGFEVLEDLDVVYCKSGPYQGEADKAFFLGPEA